MQPSQESLQRSHIKSLYHEVVLAFVLVLKPCQHSFLPWSNICTCICYEVALSFAFVMKLYQHSSFAIKLPRHFICIKATSTLHSYRCCANIHFCHEVTTTLHSHRNRANVHLCHEAMTTLHISTRTHIEVAPIFALRSCQHSSLPWSHDNTPH